MNNMGIQIKVIVKEKIKQNINRYLQEVAPLFTKHNFEQMSMTDNRLDLNKMNIKNLLSLKQY